MWWMRSWSAHTHTRTHTHVYTHAHTHTCTRTHTHTHVHARTHTHTCTRTHTHTHVYTHAHTHTHVYTHAHAHMHKVVRPRPQEVMCRKSSMMLSYRNLSVSPLVFLFFLSCLVIECVYVYVYVSVCLYDAVVSKFERESSRFSFCPVW